MKKACHLILYLYLYIKLHSIYVKNLCVHICTYIYTFNVWEGKMCTCGRKWMGCKGGRVKDTVKRNLLPLILSCCLHFMIKTFLNSQKQIICINCQLRVKNSNRNTKPKIKLEAIAHTREGVPKSIRKD